MWNALPILAAWTIAAVVPADTLPYPWRAEHEYRLAKETAQRVLTGTKALLEAELAAKGPAGALGACQAVALAEAMKHEQPGWRVRRVSLKLRNPADAPTKNEEAVLRQWEARHRKKPLGPEVELAEVGQVEGTPVLHYMKPIVVAPACLNCHGTRLAPDVRKALRERYPRDRATGYRVGDLRGAISVTVPLASSAPGNAP